MDAPIITWSISELNDHLYFLKKRLEAFTRQKVFLVNINSEVKTAWQGIAGATFGEMMDIDIQNYESILSDLDSLVTDLTNAIGKYETCETNIKSEINSLNGKIHK